MQNIDPIFFLTPVAVMGISFGLVAYWHRKKSLGKWVLLYSFIAYFGAMALKYAVQIPTLHGFESAVNSNPAALGLYYGLQTVIFEVGGAYIVARYAVRRKDLGRKDAAGYGFSLAMWENGVFIGGLTLINYAIYYAILSSGNSSLSQLIFDELSKSAPALFFPPAQALPNIALGILERISSLIAHLCWGFLAVLAVVFRRRLYLAIALPMGLLDFFVPFVSYLGTTVFEVVIFLLSLLFLAITLRVTRRSLRSYDGESSGSLAPSPPASPFGSDKSDTTVH